MKADGRTDKELEESYCFLLADAVKVRLPLTLHCALYYLKMTQEQYRQYLNCIFYLCYFDIYEK